MTPERMMTCGPCARSTPHEYTGDSWRCLRCLLRQTTNEITSLVVALDGQRATTLGEAWHSHRCMEIGQSTCTNDCAAARMVLSVHGVI